MYPFWRLANPFRVKDPENSDAGIAIIFDMDGVLIDSEPNWKIAEVEIFRELGVPLTEAMTQQTTGLRMDACVEYWRKRYPFGGDAAEISAEITSKVALMRTVTAKAQTQKSRCMSHRRRVLDASGGYTQCWAISLLL